jgi:hypothetical protein
VPNSSTQSVAWKFKRTGSPSEQENACRSQCINMPALGLIETCYRSKLHCAFESYGLRCFIDRNAVLSSLRETGAAHRRNRVGMNATTCTSSTETHGAVMNSTAVSVKQQERRGAQLGHRPFSHDHEHCHQSFEHKPTCTKGTRRQMRLARGYLSFRYPCINYFSDVDFANWAPS